MQQHDIEVAPGRELRAPVTADRDECHAELVAEQLGQPTVDEACIGPAERRALQVLVGEELLALLAK
jgi:hypothetical protein